MESVSRSTVEELPLSPQVSRVIWTMRQSGTAVRRLPEMKDVVRLGGRGKVDEAVGPNGVCY